MQPSYSDTAFSNAWHYRGRYPSSPYEGMSYREPRRLPCWHPGLLPPLRPGWNYWQNLHTGQIEARPIDGSVNTLVKTLVPEAFTERGIFLPK